MKTEKFIAVLAADQAVETKAASGVSAIWLLAATIVAAAAFYSIFGLRAGFANAPIIAATAMKLCFTAPLAFAALLLAQRLAQPGAPRMGRIALLAVPTLILTGLLAVDFAQNGMIDWRARLFGQTALVCPPLIILVSLLPFAAAVRALRAGAPEEPFFAGAVAGVAAAGIGASVYALHCPEDSPLFMAVWYSLAAFAMAVIGAASGRWLRW